MTKVPPAITGGNADVRRAHVHAAVDLLLDVLLDVREPATPPAVAPTHDPLVDRREIARLLAVSQATIDRLTRAGMPYIPVGDVRRYDLDTCRGWLVEHRQRPAEQASTSGPRAASASATVADPRDPIGGVRLPRGQRSYPVVARGIR